MKRKICFLMAACLLALAGGCAKKEHAMTIPPATLPPQITASAVTESYAEETAAPTKAPETVPPTEHGMQTEPAQIFEPYLQKIPYADQSIFDGPGYDYVFAGTVKLAGTYTIVEERWDEEGNLWGRLKSGAGWICLTDIQIRDCFPAPISANFADDLLLESGNFHHCRADTSPYAVRVAFRAYESLRDVTLYAMNFGEDFELSDELYYLSSLEPEMPLVADLAFPGDMTTYTIGFLDESSTQRYFCIAISGRNGALTVWEDTP